jgi:hypothetical protein
MSLGWSGDKGNMGRACDTRARMENYLQVLIKKNCTTMFAWNTQRKWADNIKILKKSYDGGME